MLFVPVSIKVKSFQKKEQFLENIDKSTKPC
jgi:hypothetical protein